MKKKFKKKSFIFFLLLLSLFGGLLFFFGRFGEKEISSSLKSSTQGHLFFSEQIDDEANLLSYSFKFRLNQFLSHLRKNHDIYFLVKLAVSSHGYSLEEQINPLINAHRDKEKFALFYLSLADRQFKISVSPLLKDQISDADLNFLVNLIKPALTHHRYEEGLSQFFSAFIFKVDPTDPLLAPRPTPKEKQNLKTFLLFLGTLLILLILGRRFFFRPRIFLRSINSQSKDQFIHFQGFF